jgi:hypothetical protein
MKRARRLRYICCTLILCLLAQPALHGQEVIDRIAARIENDVILLSDVRLLSRYQLLVEGKSEDDAQILNRLIDQWIVRNEATVARRRTTTKRGESSRVSAKRMCGASPPIRSI